jgi:hypothetical protein
MSPTGGVWNNDNALYWAATGSSTLGVQWVPLGFATKAASAQHSYDPVGGSWDTAGQWHYVKIVADMYQHQYVSVQLDESVYSLPSLAMYQGIGDTGAKAMHQSAEFAATTSTRRFMSVAQVQLTAE